MIIARAWGVSSSLAARDAALTLCASPGAEPGGPRGGLGDCRPCALRRDVAQPTEQAAVDDGSRKVTQTADTTAADRPAWISDRRDLPCLRVQAVNATFRRLVKTGVLRSRR